jgi:hypothetical protein
MTRLNPSLFLKRLVVTQHGAIAYDQKFHLGVNVIRGTNSHGKSTIAEFIFFILGGDTYKWKLEASACDDVWAEVLINGATAVLKRSVTKKRGQGMSIFYGTYEEAKHSAVEGWRVYPYRRNSDTESFSEALFAALKMPETLGEASGHITMHQLLRLIYIDQITPPDALMRTEEFDSPLTRSIILDYLLGVYDNLLYQDQLDYRNGKRRQDEIRGQLKQLETVLDRAEIDTDPKQLLERTDTANRHLAALDQEIAVLRGMQNEAQAKQNNEIAPLAAKSAEKRKETYELSNQTRDLAIEIEDSAQFIASLETRIAALDDAAVTRDALGSMPLHFCPQCLSPLSATAVEGACVLCKQPANTEITKTHAARMRQELSLQVRESKMLFERKQNEYTDKRDRLEKVAKETQLLQRDYERLVATVQTSRDAKIDTLLVEKGSIERTIADLLQKNKIMQVLLNLRAQEAELATRIQQLNISIQKRLSDQKAKFYKAIAVVQKFTVCLLQRDLPLEERFRLACDVSLRPETNTFAVDGENQFSASSMIYLKNSIHCALLFASLELPYLRYPRLFVCDNIEDKGMTTNRSQNFQRNILALSRDAKVEHQIIFTTSMVDTSLDTPEFAIGPNYVGGLKTLNIAPSTSRSNGGSSSQPDISIFSVET